MCWWFYFHFERKKNWFTWGLSCSHSYVKWHQQQQGHDFRTKAAVTLQALMLGSNHSALKVPISYPILYTKCPTSLTVNKPVPWNHLHVHSSTQEYVLDLGAWTTNIIVFETQSITSLQQKDYLLWRYSLSAVHGEKVKSCSKLTLKYYIFGSHSSEHIRCKIKIIKTLYCICDN